MALNLDNLQKAILVLEQSLQSSEKGQHSKILDASTRDTLKAGVIQNFEVAYEQCWKMMKRWLGTNIGPEAGDGVTRRELFRLAAENKLIDGVDLWMEFHRARNETSHTYDADTAGEVYETAKNFLKESQKFLKAIESRND